MNYKRILKFIGIAVSVIVIVMASVVAPIDDTPLQERDFYQRMMMGLDSFDLKVYPPLSQLQVGWSKFSIVPDHPVPMAGYRPRAKFNDVHDPLYARVMAIGNGNIISYFITVDLLLFPPELKNRVLQKVGTSSSEFLFFSATHTHTSVGGWDPTVLGTILMGDFEEEWIEDIANKIHEHLLLARQSMKGSMLYSWDANGLGFVTNRVDKSGESLVDGKLRGIKIVRDDGSKALLFTYSLHPTLISRHVTSLSGDYPSAVISELDKEYEYSQFLAGMMGSHGIAGMPVYEFPLVDMLGQVLSNRIIDADQRFVGNQLVIKTGRLKVEHGPSQLRLTKHLKLRNWVFEEVTGPLDGEVVVLKIGNILFLGMSCDFSGELYQANGLENVATANDTQLIITSFNGDYTGYITHDAHYENSTHEEMRALNWVGPYFGEYYTQIIEGLIKKGNED